MDLLENWYPTETHILVFNNAPTHLKQADNALSACKMSKYPTKPGRPFVGMVDLLEERGYKDIDGICAKCPGFKCPTDTLHCCLHCMLYNELDFAEVESLLEETCRARGFQVVFLPKFHCKLNFIKQCWGHTKCTYRQFPPSNSEADLEHNDIAALDAVPLCTMRQ
ncbi:hypothetical protein SERLA73DRAFT_118506 [Serpula lacrymans var. lacrymans S7.3]|uniref:Uncharacterized protein n=2 Tax=Serpula lacrymans var. lacrymans TaxID=341189 RepID=F8PFS0_SERL3|nr:uncharacterized protein SERLADRAFT_364415 [Serpula lacrymans var. lacrymans S7.9]EGO04271.1 hypothetical protein SERLA73DRAFT_118506 [Serpula lacrymans var. lacrymans S7.3]EGO30206.1 hypothetical protein SERLADRAFT_364415 [Serpula lacrymans var. lacrymans S7.9]